MTVYTGSPLDSHELIQFFRREAAGLRSLRKLVISPEKTVVLDVNGDGIEFPGLSYGSAVLEDLLRETGVIFNPRSLHDAANVPGGVKEFRLSASHAWGEDRIL